MIRWFNRWLDTIPRFEYGLSYRSISVFRTFGLAGYTLAVPVCLGLTLATNSSLAVACAGCVAAGASFFLYAWLRKITFGRENLVLLEHVWVALACVACLTHYCDVPVAPYWDSTSVGLCVFLAAGRCGCLFVGCCHGLPCALGIRYPDEFPPPRGSEWRNGLRLFPVQMVEGGCLLCIGVVGAMLIQHPGKATVWFLVAYAVVRFGLETLRGDRRPAVLGVSQAQWMSVMQLCLALEWSQTQCPLTRVARLITTSMVWAAIVAVILAFALRHRRLHLPSALADEIAQAYVDSRAELADLVRQGATASPLVSAPRKLSHQLRLVATQPTVDSNDWVHIAVGREQDFDLYALCQLVCRAIPDVDSATGALTESNALHLRVRCAVHHDTDRGGVEKSADSLYRTVLAHRYT